MIKLKNRKSLEIRELHFYIGFARKDSWRTWHFEWRSEAGKSANHDISEEEHSSQREEQRLKWVKQSGEKREKEISTEG